jgi:FkbM family methyltransferase
MPKVSICIPAYNQTRYLSKTLRSILAQTFDDYEVIVTDDSSSTIVKDLLNSYDFKGRLKYFHNITALGSPQNWNYCISKATGDYIKIMHHDDSFTGIDSLKYFVEAMENSNATFAFANAEVFYEKTNRAGVHSPGPLNIMSLENDPAMLFRGNFIGAPSMIMFKKDENLCFDENLKWLVDVDFYIRFLKKHPHFQYIDKPLIHIVAEAEHTVTATCLNNSDIEVFENFYLFDKLKPSFSRIKSVDSSFFLLKLLRRLKITHLYEIEQAGYKKSLPMGFKALFFFSQPVNRFILILKKVKSLLIAVPHKKLAGLSVVEPLLALKRKFKKTSYAQSGEDMIIDYIFTQLGIFAPSYLDIGAHHPFYLSNTALFYEKGSRGINIEPDGELFKQFARHRQRDININCGIGNENNALELNIMNVPALNTFSGEEAKRLVEDGFQIVKKEIIPVQTIAFILNKYNHGVFPDLLTIDIEGFDEEVIKTIDFTAAKPTVICIETITYSDKGRGLKNTALINYIQEKGYLLYADTNINSIFVLRQKWER